jgi:hypothetical protein
MNKKLYAQLLLAILVANYAVADEGSFFSTVGRSYNGNTFNVPKGVPTEKISFSDAKDLKRQMKDISKNVSTLSAERKDEVKTKVTKLADLVKKNQVAHKGKVKKYTRQ